jgi:hypothetical protein
LKETQVDKATTLLESLSGEQTRWKKNLNSIENLKNNIDALCFVVSYFTTFMLALTEREREAKLFSFLKNFLKVDFGRDLGKYLNLQFTSETTILEK